MGTGESLGREYGGGTWWHGLACMFAAFVRYRLGTGSRGMVSPFVAFTCADLDGDDAWASATGGMEGQEDRGSRDPECENEPSGGGEDFCGAVSTSEALGRGNCGEAWLPRLPSTFAVVVRLGDEEVAVSEYGLGTVPRGMVSLPVNLSCVCCDGGSDWGEAVARKSRGGGKVGVLLWVSGLQDGLALVKVGWLCVVVACCQAANSASTVCSQETMLAISCFSAE